MKPQRKLLRCLHPWMISVSFLIVITGSVTPLLSQITRGAEVYDTFRNRDDFIKLKKRLQEVNSDLVDQGIHFYERDKSYLMTGYSYGEFYDWDLYFENIYLSYFGESLFCFTNFKAFFNLQYLNGFIPRTIGTNPARLYHHFKPFFAQIAILGSKLTGDYTWLLEKGTRGGEYPLKDISYYDQLKLYLDHWIKFNDFDCNGLPVWGDAEHSGMDNQFRRAGERRSFYGEGVDLASYIHREYKAMEHIAQKLDMPYEAERFRQKAGALARLINDTFWDEERGFYFDRNEQTGERIYVYSVSGFMPLWAGIATEEQAARLVKHMTDPDKFWINYPLASYAQSEPTFQLENWPGPTCNWRGTTWIPVNYMVFHALKDYGYPEIAASLAARTYELVLEKNEVTREYYNGETGGGLGLNPFWGWSAIAYFMMIEDAGDYNPMDFDTKEIKTPGKDIFDLSLDLSAFKP